MIKIFLVIGTRPEAIKLAPLIKAFKKYSKIFDTKVCITAQHRELLDQVLSFFKISPDYDLNLMKPNQNLYEITANILLKMKPILKKNNPQYIFVHGDTTTTLAASLASFYNESKICHIEAGLRTYNKKSPFPEEMNRQITTRLADYHFAPTEESKNNLINENINKENIIITGNTVIDALIASIKKVKNNPSSNIKNLSKDLKDREVVLVTFHRRENYGDGFIRICEALKEIALKNPNRIIVFPVHLNPKVQKPVNNFLSDIKNIILLDPLNYEDFIWMMNRSKLIITDSGGIQEEAPSLGKPVLVLRETTERPEAVKAGTVLLVGTNKNLIIKETLELLNDASRYKKISRLYNPYGDGKACKRIIDFIIKLENIKN
mgnify:CR=1 FL=1